MPLHLISTSQEPAGLKSKLWLSCPVYEDSYLNIWTKYIRSIIKHKTLPHLSNEGELFPFLKLASHIISVQLKVQYLKLALLERNFRITLPRLFLWIATGQLLASNQLNTRFATDVPRVEQRQRLLDSLQRNGKSERKKKESRSGKVIINIENELRQATDQRVHLSTEVQEEVLVK